MEPSVIDKLWKNILYIRSVNRFRSIDIIHTLFQSFYELHGDRYYGDDKSMITGLGLFHGIPVTIIAQYRGKSDTEKKCRQYGMPMPEGYRKSLRIMKQAEKFNRPVICFIDTPGAYPGIGAEERGQAEAIAKNLFTMSTLSVPIISVIVGEGGSGGALALGIADRTIMFEHSIYSVVSPEGCASILWKSSAHAPDAAYSLKLTAADLHSFQIVDKIIEEQNSSNIFYDLDDAIYQYLKELNSLSREEIVTQRQEKYRNIGKPLDETEVDHADQRVK